MIRLTREHGGSASTGNCLRVSAVPMAFVISGLLDSALVARRKTIHAYEPDADRCRLAAAYCAGVVKNHPFIDGNKRTGILSAVAFLGL